MILGCHQIYKGLCAVRMTRRKRRPRSRLWWWKDLEVGESCCVFIDQNFERKLRSSVPGVQVFGV